jgi:hypothetical protein
MAYLWVINNLIKDYYCVKYDRLLKNTKARQGSGTCRALKPVLIVIANNPGLQAAEMLLPAPQDESF